MTVNRAPEGRPLPCTRHIWHTVIHEHSACSRLTPGERLLAMLAAREWVVSAKRARLCCRFPDLSPQEINLKVL